MPDQHDRLDRLLRHGAATWTTVHARGRVRSHPGEATSSLLRRVWEADPDALAEAHWELWLQRTETGLRRRVDHWADDDPAGAFVTIGDDTHWSSAHRDGAVIGAGEGRSLTPPEEAFFSAPADILGAVTFETVTAGTAAGRPALVVLAHPVRGADAEGVPTAFFTGLNDDYWNGDAYELAVDSEHGVVLRVSAYRDQLWRTEVVVDEADFNQPLPPHFFQGPGVATSHPPAP